MIQEPLDLRRAIVLVWRRKVVLGTVAVVGLLAGAGYAAVRPPAVTAQALVLLGTDPSHQDTALVRTQVVIAQSDPVLAGALKSRGSPLSVQSLRDEVEVVDETSNILAISAEGATAGDAQDTANAMAESYVDYVQQPGNLPDKPVQARVLQPATIVSGTRHVPRMIDFGLLGGLIATVIASFVILALTHRDRRLRQRDEIASSIGVPVLASVNVQRPSDTAGWTKLLRSYTPGAVDAWRLRKALQYLGVADLGLPVHRRRGPFSLTLLSLSIDRAALALGPQLAVFAASRGIPTVLVLGPQQNVQETATLRAACAAALPPPNSLRLVVSDSDMPVAPADAALAVVVVVVDPYAPKIYTREAPSWDELVGGTSRDTATVLGLSAGVATAEQLARVAAGAAAAGHEIAGIFVADPDPADPTTGRLPQMIRPDRVSRSNRAIATAMEISNEHR